MEVTHGLSCRLHPGYSSGHCWQCSSLPAAGTKPLYGTPEESWSEQPGTFDKYSGYGFAFLHYPILLPKLSSIDLLNVLSAIIIFYIALLLIEELTSQKKGAWQLGPGSGLPGLNGGMVVFEDSSVVSVR